MINHTQKKDLRIDCGPILVTIVTKYYLWDWLLMLSRIPFYDTSDSAVYLDQEQTSTEEVYVSLLLEGLWT